MVETKPSKIMFWYHYLPSTPNARNWWFDRIRSEAEKYNITCERDAIAPSSTRVSAHSSVQSLRRQTPVECIKTRGFDEIFGNSVRKFAHKADVIRLEALLKHGGIYLDLDVYTVRSFAPLLNFETVLGIEGGAPPLDRQGLCNGVILAEPNSSFLRRWYEAYRDFSDEQWASLSVQMPFRLAQRHPEDLLVLDPFAFFYPMWDAEGLKMVHSR